MEEPLLKKDDGRFVVLPVVYEDVYAMYKKAVASFWIAEEVDIGKDLVDWNEKLNHDERHFISMIIAFFAGSDGLVNENLASRFYNEIQNSEVRLFYGFQIAMEGIHSEVYSNIIDCYIQDKTKKLELLNAMSHYECIKKKADWCKRYIASDAPFCSRLVAFAIVEGVFFSGAFCSIFWLKKRGLLKALSFANELISRDEALHTEFAVLLYSKLKNRMPGFMFHKMMTDAVNIETEFICEALPCRLIGMNALMMTEYIRFCADRLAVQLGYSKIYGAKCPFDWMEMISVQSKTNFFEMKVSDYALATKTGTESAFDFNADF